MALLALLLAWLALAPQNVHTPTHQHGCSGYYDNIAHMYLPHLCEDDAIADLVRHWSTPLQASTS